MKQIDLIIKIAAKPLCWSTGFVAMDIVDAEVGEFAATGGSCGNVMAILAWFGWQTTPVARLGEDTAGNFIREELRGTGVNTDFLSRETRVQTPVVIQRFGQNKDGGRVHRFSLTCPECGAWLPRHRPITLQQANALIESNESPSVYYFDRVSPGALRLAGAARDEGALVVFEPSSIGDEKKFQEAVDLCHVLKYSQDRLGHVPDLALATSPKIIVETQGQDGLRFRLRNRWTHLCAFSVNPTLDAAGSGDWCTAGLIHRLGQAGAKGVGGLRKDQLVSALQTGQSLAAINCRFFGARGTMLAATFKQLNNKLRQLEDNSELEEMEGEELTTSEPPIDFCRKCDSNASVINRSTELPPTSQASTI